MAILQSRTQTGISWVKESLALFKLSPRKWLMLALAYVGLFMILPAQPGFQFFAFISILLWPVFIAVAMRMFRNAELNKTESLTSVLQALQPKIAILALLGALCLLYGVAVSFILNVDIQGMAVFAQANTAMTESKMALLMQKMLPFLLKLTVFLIPLMMATWFAPMLIAFNNYSLIKAIKSSVAGSLQYMVALGAAWMLLTSGIVMLMLGVGIVVGILAALVPSVAQLFMSLIIFGCLLLASALMLAFQYVSYRDIFRAA